MWRGGKKRKVGCGQAMLKGRHKGFVWVREGEYACVYMFEGMSYLLEDEGNVCSLCRERESALTSRWGDAER